MQAHLNEILFALTAGVVGAVIGLSFGTVQEAAFRRNERLQQGGKLKSGWAVMPGSMRRVAYLLVALAAIQFICPMLFAGNTQWWVSGGVVAGYGWMLWKQLRARLSGSR